MDVYVWMLTADWLSNGLGHAIRWCPGEAMHEVHVTESRHPHGMLVQAGHLDPPDTNWRVLHVDDQSTVDVQENFVIHPIN